MTTLKMLGAVLVILGTAAAGFREVFRMKLRIETLSGFLSALELMEAEIYFNLTPLYEICRKLGSAARTPLKPFFSALAEGEKSVFGKSFGELWRETLNASRLELKDEERQVLLELSNTVGRYDIDGQVKAISYARRRLEGFLNEAAAVKAKMGRVYGAVGFAAGAAVVIILI